MYDHHHHALREAYRAGTLRILAAPTDRLLSLDEIKAQCNAEEFTDQDALLSGIGLAAEGVLDGATGDLRRALLTQRWAVDFAEFSRAPLAIPLPPLQSVEAVKYVDQSGVTQTVDPALYIVHAGGPRGSVEIVPGQCWPSPRRQQRAVTVEFTAGYGVAEDVPAAIRQAALLLCSHYFENRDAVVGVENRDSSAPLPMGVDFLISRFIASPD